MKRTFLAVTFCLCVSCGQSAEPVLYPAVTDSTGCRIERITPSEFDDYQVQGVSSDGTLLSYTTNLGEDEDGNTRYETRILNLVTGDSTLLVEAINNPGAFSPDDQYLVAAAYDDTGFTEILELHLESGEITVIAPHEQWDWLPSYSADGRFIVFNSYRQNGEADVHTYERATGDLRRLTDFPGYDAHAQFSPDGERILFHRMLGDRENDRYDFDLFVHDLRDGTETRLTDGPYEESYGAFSPDGQHIVFSWDGEEAPDNHNLYVRAPDGSHSALTDGEWKDYYAYWTRDGKYIYFNSNRAGDFNVHRMRMQGTTCLREQG